MTSRIALIAGLLAAAVAPLAAAQTQSRQAQSQQEKCEGGWEVKPRDKAAACTALIDGKQLTGDELASAYYFRGEALKDMAQWDKAMADLNESIRLLPDAAAPYVARGDLFSNTRKFDDAIADFDKAIQLSEPDGHLFRQRGDAYEAKGMHERAIADYDEAVRLDPDDDFVLSTRCRVRAVWGRELEEAVKDCSKAISLDGDNMYSYEQRGLAYLRLGQYPEAIADYGEVLKKYRGPEALYGRGLARIRSGDPTGGKEDIAAAARIDAHIARTFAGWGVKP
jgi:tetratricopeptide (TPR) repeat protein